MKFLTVLLGFLAFNLSLAAQSDTIPEPTEEEDYSMYENAETIDDSKKYCSPKIFDLSPQRFVSVGWDFQMPYEMQFSNVGEYEADATVPYAETGKANYAGGLRLSANIPVISRTDLLWQLGANFWDTRFNIDPTFIRNDNAGIIETLNENGLRTAGISTTLFKPLGEKQFLLFQGSADLSGDYTLDNMQSLRYLRYSAALIWGKRPSDRKQWGLGVARTYRVGEMNYIPVIFHNWTAPNRNWGTEVLFPARAHVRYKFSSRSILLGGYELEGQSYRIANLSDADNSLEIRRGEFRARLDYQRQISGFVWLGVQAGWRYNWGFDADRLPDGREFFRGFFGTQDYAMLNNVGNPLYFNITLNLVSP
jgi:hypothetical protein